MKQLEGMAMQQKKGAVFVDLFGGSGLVSHTIKQARPDCRVVYCRRLRTPLNSIK
ncbi:MAG: hypothetical protein IJV22_08425 [Bacteroidales bacterium]|nr:hypothetical protein [Bacteroidales bacterium]